MSIFTKEMEQMMSFYERQIRKYKHTYENAPEGRLLYQKRNGKVQMLQVIKREGKRVRKGINTNDELIRGLAQKEFARKSIDILEHDLKVCKAAAERYIPYDPDESDMEKINRNKAWGDVPDFTFMDRSGRFFFWEYMGMMDDPRSFQSCNC